MRKNVLVEKGLDEMMETGIVSDGEVADSFKAPEMDKAILPVQDKFREEWGVGFHYVEDMMWAEAHIKDIAEGLFGPYKKEEDKTAEELARDKRLDDYLRAEKERIGYNDIEIPVYDLETDFSPAMREKLLAQIREAEANPETRKIMPYFPFPETKYAQNNHTETMNDGETIDNRSYLRYGEGFPKDFIEQMEKDEEFIKILNEYVIPNEGGFVNGKNDRGGKTKFGISKRTYKDENIEELTRERANVIIYRDFYKWNGLNKLPYPIRGFIVDFGMSTSPLNAIQTVHKVLGLSPQGNIIGKSTLNKLSHFSEKDYEKFLIKYKQEMEKYFRNIVQHDNSQKVYLKGWLNRTQRAHLAK